MQIASVRLSELLLNVGEPLSLVRVGGNMIWRYRRI